MCKRKIKTIETIFFLILFSFIVLLLPQDAHARVRVVTKGTTSTIRDTDGVIEDEFSDINCIFFRKTFGILEYISYLCHKIAIIIQNK